MKTLSALPLLCAAALTACSGQPDVEVESSAYAEVTRTGYFEGLDDSLDWRTARVSGAAARRDLLVVDSLMKNRYAYNDADQLDETAMLQSVSDALPDEVSAGDFAMILQKALALSIDGHAPRVAGLLQGGERERIEDNPPGRHYLPFELRSTGSRIVAFDAQNRTLIEPDHPYLAAIDGLEVSEWIDAAQSIVVAGSPQLRWNRGSWHLANLGFLRMELRRPAIGTATLVFENEAGDQIIEREIALVDASVSVEDRYPFAEDAAPRVPSDIAYFRLRRMESDPEYIAGFADWIQRSRTARGAIIDIRDNGGGSRLPLITLLPHILAPDAAPVVANAGRLKLPAGCPGPGCETPDRGYLADRFMLPLDAFPVGTPERDALDAWLPSFEPSWSPPDEGFSEWHYLVVAPDPDPVFAGKPVVVLMNNSNFSASDIFLSAMKSQGEVLLLGTASSGGSARQQEYVLPNTGLAIRLASLASFQTRSGELYDGVGIQPDIEMFAEPGFFVNQSDDVIDRAIERIRSAAADGPQSR